MKKQILVTLYFDTKDNLTLEDRDYDRFILNIDSNKDFRDKFFKVIEGKKYSLDEYRKGFKPILQTEQINLFELEVF